MYRKGSFTSNIQTNKMEHITEFTKNWSIMDAEYIRVSPTHRCIRKIYMLSRNGIDELEMEFYPCTQYKDLEPRYQRAFRFCRNQIHRLSYNPKSCRRDIKEPFVSVEIISYIDIIDISYRTIRRRIHRCVQTLWHI